MQGFDEHAIFKTKKEVTVIKFVNGKVSTIQRLDNEVSYFLLKKGNKYIIMEGKELDPNFANVIDVMEEPMLSPKISENTGEYKFVKLDNKIEKIRENPEDVISLVLNSRYPISGIVNITRSTISLSTSKGFSGSDVRNSIDGYFRAFNGDSPVNGLLPLLATQNLQ